MENNIKINQLYNNDCMEVIKQIEDNSIDLIITDPPYPVTPRGSAGNSGGMLQKKINRSGKVFEHNNINCSVYAPEFYRILKDGSHCYIMSNHVNLQKMINVFTDLRTDDEKYKNIKPYGFHFIKSLIWDKGNKIMGQYYMSQFEYILFFRKGKGVKINNCGTSDILSVPNKKTKGEDGKNLHDTEKPVELMKILIENSSRPNDLVCDFFAGVGATQMACFESGRNFLGCEIDKKYYDIANDRLDAAKSQVKLF